MRFDNALSYADLEALGWPQIMIDDYMGRLIEFQPVQGVDTDPNGVHMSTLNRFYVDTATPGLWFNPIAGVDTGWIQLI